MIVGHLSPYPLHLDDLRVWRRPAKVLLPAHHSEVTFALLLSIKLDRHPEILSLLPSNPSVVPSAYQTSLQSLSPVRAARPESMTGRRAFPVLPESSTG